MKKVIIAIIYLIIFFFCYRFSYAKQIYQERIIPQGKVIVGLDQEEALSKYGIPSSASNKIWSYPGPGNEKLYIYLEKTSLAFLYPRFCTGPVGGPLEFKIFSGSDEVNDVTAQSQLIINDPDSFDMASPGVIIPKKVGDYQIIALYNDVYSNPSSISITKTPKTDEDLISVDIIPYNPRVSVNGVVNFSAFGTFNSINGYFVRDITVKAQWFMEQHNESTQLKGQEVRFYLPGKFKVFCRYGGMESLPQNIEVEESLSLGPKELKHISIIPAYVYLVSGKRISPLAYATYKDISVRDVTKEVDWKIQNKQVLGKYREEDSRVEKNNFITKLRGISGLTAELRNITSPSSKITVYADIANEEGFTDPEKQKNKDKEENKSVEDIFKSIKNDVEKLGDKLNTQERFRKIKIVPDICDIHKGEEKQLAAFGIKQDSSEEDITILAQWISLDEKVAIVRNGKVSTVAPGKTEIYIRFRNMESQHIPLIVREANLVSIDIIPQYLKIVMGEKSSLSATGYFSDSSHSDVTSLVSWVFVGQKKVKIDKGVIIPNKVGKIGIFAEYLGIKSSPITIEVVHEKYWLLKLFVKILCFLLLTMFLVSLYFYILTEIAKRSIISLFNSPKDFIIALYNNLNKILIILGYKQDFYMLPLSYAGCMDKIYAKDRNLFFKFTQQFEEAKYSKHVFSQEVSLGILEDYNNLLKVIFGHHKKVILVYGFFSSLIKKTPFFELKISPRPNY